ncbi:MAG: hypothetical protein QOD99_185 [Chthoniobacter sp.]|nr:hypothetical protein [Chthoniobacter sp.]
MSLCGHPNRLVDEPAFDTVGCLLRVRQGDEEAATELMQQLYPFVFRIVRSHLPRRTSEEDLCQMIFIKVFSNLEKYSGRVPLEHWVSRIAVNTCLNQLKAEMIRPELRWADLSDNQAAVLDSLARTSDELSPRESVASREVVEKLLAKLNPQDRLVIHLLHLDGYSIEEVRQRTGWNIALVKVRAFRARRKLKNIFEQLTMEGKL